MSNGTSMHAPRQLFIPYMYAHTRVIAFVSNHCTHALVVRNIVIRLITSVML